MVRFAIAACCITLTIDAASAEWQHGVQADAFNGDRYWASVGDRTTTIGFSCVKGTAPRLFYELPDRISEANTEIFNGKHTYELLFLTDDDAPEAAAAQAWFTQSGNQYMVDVESPW